MCSVDVSDLKADLMEALDALKEGVLKAMRQRLRQSSEKLIEQFQLAEVQLNKASGTGEEVLALKKFIQRSQAQQEKMREDILHNKRSVDFLVRHQMPVTQEVQYCFYPRSRMVAIESFALLSSSSTVCARSLCYFDLGCP